MSRGSPHPRSRALRRALALAALLTAAFAAAPARADVVDDWNVAASDIITGAAPGGAGLVPPTRRAAWRSSTSRCTTQPSPSTAATRPTTLARPCLAARRSRPPWPSPATTRWSACSRRSPPTSTDVSRRPSHRSRTAGQERRHGGRRGRRRGPPRAARARRLGRRHPSFYVQSPAAAGVWLPLSGRGFFPWVSHVTPFTLLAGDQFLSEPPPALTSRRYARDYNEVQELGRVDSATRTPEQTNLALFFADKRCGCGTAPSARSRRTRGSPRPTRRGCTRRSTSPGPTRSALGRQVRLPAVAPGGGHHDGLRRRQPPHVHGCDVEAAARDAELRRLPVRPRLLHRRGHGRAAARGSAATGSRSPVESIQPDREPGDRADQPDAGVPPLPRGHRRGGGHPDAAGHPLPLRHGGR